jgi:hypothetical protein
MDQYFVIYKVKDPKTKEVLELFSGPHSEEVVLDVFQSIKHSAGVRDAWISDCKPMRR